MAQTNKYKYKCELLNINIKIKKIENCWKNYHFYQFLKFEGAHLIDKLICHF